MNLLAGDLGGTKTLLAVYSSEGYYKKIYSQYYTSSEWESFDSILIDFFQKLPKSISIPQYGCIGVAGLVVNNKVKITNLGWDIDSIRLSSISKINTIEIINDFSVLIYGIPFLKNSQYEIIQGKLKSESKYNQKSVAIIGAGTGLGIARGLITPENTYVLPSEGGHKEFAPRNDDEWKLVNWIKKNLNLERISIERIVSGKGLGLIARWKLEEMQDLKHPLQEISKKLDSPESKFIDFPSMVWDKANKNDKLMTEALQIWLSAYGSAAGDLALQELCSSGLWIAGGTAAKNLNGINSSTFLNAFCNKGRFQTYLEKMPLIVLKDPECTLFSSACRAHLIAKSNGRLN